MEANSQEFVLGENVFPNRQDAIQSLVTTVNSEIDYLIKLKKERSSGITPTITNDKTLSLTQDTMIINIKRCLELVARVAPEEDNVQALLDSFFAGSGRKPIVREVENEGDVLEIANALVVMTQSLRELHDMVKTYRSFQYQSINLTASLLREPDKISGISIVQRALNCYAKLSKLKGYKEWEKQDGRFRSEIYIDKLHSLAKPNILDFLVARNHELTTYFECLVNYLPLDIAKYSEIVRSQASIPEI